MSSLVHTRLSLVVIFLSGLLPAPLFAQEADTPKEPSSPPEAPATDPLLAKQLASPRAVFRTLIDSVEAGDLNLASRCLDLSQVVGIHEVKQETGRDYAQKLKRSILDKMLRIDYSRLPAEGSPELNGKSEFLLAELADGVDDELLTDFAMIQVAVGEDGLWRFTPETVERIPELFQRWNNKQTVTSENNAETSLLESTQQVFRKSPFLNNPLVAFIIIVVIGLAAHWIVCNLLALLTRVWLHWKKDTGGTEQLDRVWRPVGLCVQGFIWYLCVNHILLETGSPLYLQLGSKWALTIKSVTLVMLKSFAVLAAVWTIFGVIDLAASFWRKRAAGAVSKFDELLIPLVTKFLKVIAICGGILTMAQAFGSPLAGLFGAMGIGAMALALASQDAVSNLFGTVTVLVDRPFEVGDWIIADGVEGSVETVGFRSTRIRTFYNSLITLPNSRLTTAVVDNMGKRRFRRIRATLSVQYDTTPQQIDAFCEGVREILKRHPYTRKDYYHVYLNGFGDNALEIMLYCFVECPDWSIELREKHRLYLAIIQLAEELGVSFAFPTRTLHMYQEQPAETPTDIADPEFVGRRLAAKIAGTPAEAQRLRVPVEFGGPAEVDLEDRGDEE